MAAGRVAPGRWDYGGRERGFEMQRAKASASPPGPSVAGRSLDKDGKEDGSTGG